MTGSSAFRRYLRDRLLRQLSLGMVAAAVTPACGGEAVIDPPLGSGGASSSATSVGSTSSGMACTETTTTGGGLFRYSYCTNLSSCPSADQAFDGIALALSETCCIDPSFECEELRTIECGPFDGDDGSCCYEITTEVIPCAVPGRPLTLDGELAQAPVVTRRDWQGDMMPGLDDLTPEVRQELAERWAAEGQLEHASVASFARFALEAMAVGAPPGLIEAAHAAAADEVLHAQLAFALASAYAGQPLGPGPLALPSALPLTTDLAALAVATFREACVNETVAAIVAAERRERATDPAVRRALTTIAQDEGRHAELGWRFLAWALTQGAHIRAALEAEAEWLSSTHATMGTDPLAAHGQLSSASEACIAQLAIDEVVRPALAAALTESRPLAPLASGSSSA